MNFIIIRFHWREYNYILYIIFLNFALNAIIIYYTLNFNNRYKSNIYIYYETMLQHETVTYYVLTFRKEFYNLKNQHLFYDL